MLIDISKLMSHYCYNFYYVYNYYEYILMLIFKAKLPDKPCMASYSYIYISLYMPV